MIRSCDYCFSVFDEWLWSWCIFTNEENDSNTCLCSICAQEILISVESDENEQTTIPRTKWSWT